MSRGARHGRTGQEPRGLHEANEMNHGDTFERAWGKEVMAFLIFPDGWCHHPWEDGEICRKEANGVTGDPMDCRRPLATSS